MGMIVAWQEEIPAEGWAVYEEVYRLQLSLASSSMALTTSLPLLLPSTLWLTRWSVVTSVVKSEKISLIRKR